jgi:hypothetical protein
MEVIRVQSNILKKPAAFVKCIDAASYVDTINLSFTARLSAFEAAMAVTQFGAIVQPFKTAKHA